MSVEGLTHWLVKSAAGKFVNACGSLGSQGISSWNEFSAFKGGLRCPECVDIGSGRGSAWNGMCPAGKHGLDTQSQLCDLCDPPRAGVRFNANKPRFGLISPFAEEGLAQVLTYGARKYAPRNWQRGLSWTETVDSLRRHLAAFMQGEDVDAESGLPHVHHLQCNAMMLAHFYETATGTDDREPARDEEPPRPRDVGMSGLRGEP